MKINTKKGFTVVELVIVIAVIAILAGILIPVFSSIVQNSRRMSAWQEAQAEYLLYRTTKEMTPGAEVANDILIQVHYDNEIFFFVALDKPDSVDQEEKTSLLIFDKSNALTGFSTERNAQRRTVHNTFVITCDEATRKVVDLSADIPDNLQSVIMYELVHEDKIYNTVTVPDSKDVSGKNVGDEIEFGYYPQSEVTDSAKRLQLEKFAGIKDNSGNFIKNSDGTPKYLPKEGDDSLSVGSGSGYMWISYDYFDGSDKANYAWYLDVESNDKYPGTNKRIIYRAVYFVKYRPCYIGYAAFDSMESRRDDSCYQSGNGYDVNTIYWFKFDPIVWKITDKDSNGNYTIASKMILDAQHYQSNVDRTEYQSVITVKQGGTFKEDLKYVSDTTTFVNDWQESEIKLWLGSKDNVGDWMPQSRFANTAFSLNDRDRVLNTTLTTNGCWDYFKGEDCYLWPKGESHTYYYGGMSRSQDLYRYGSKVGKLDVSELIYYGKPSTTDYERYGGKALDNNYVWLYSFQELASDEIARWRSAIVDRGELARVKSIYPEHVAEPTKYAMAQGAYCFTQARYDALYAQWNNGEIEYKPNADGIGKGTYWLRSNSARTTFRVNFVGYDGTLGWVDAQNGNCDDVKTAYLGVRPVTRITPN